MPKNQVNDPITDQEIAFARLVLSGTVTDRQAAEASGLNPETAAYTKTKPRVRAYMIERRAAVEEQRAQEERAELSHKRVSREQVLSRLWEIANLNPEATRNSASAQMRALTMIIAIEGLIPDRRSADKKPSLPLVAATNEPFSPPAETSHTRPLTAAATTRGTPDAFMSLLVPDLRVPYSTERNPFVRC